MDRKERNEERDVHLLAVRSELDLIQVPLTKVQVDEKEGFQ